MDEKTIEAGQQRLASIRGHIEGIERMLQGPEVNCLEVMKQVKAVQAALDKVNELVMRSHLVNCVSTAMEHGQADAAVDELMETLKYRR